MKQIETYMDSVLDVLSDGIYISDREGNTLKVNTMYERLIGFRREDLVGRRVQDLVEEGVFDVVLNPQIVKTGQPATSTATERGYSVIPRTCPVRASSRSERMPTSS